MGLVLRWAINVIAVFVASWLLSAWIKFDDWVALAIFAAVLALVNIFVKPILTILTFPAVLLTLGLFILVINALMFLLAAWLVPGFHVDGFGAALLGSVIVSVVSWLLHVILPDGN